MSSPKGFTLIDFLGIVAVFLLIAILSIPNLLEKRDDANFRTFFPGETLPAPGAPCSEAEKTSLGDALTEMELNAAHKGPAAQDDLKKAKRAALEKCGVDMD
jgi:hypothetical protein